MCLSSILILFYVVCAVTNWKNKKEKEKIVVKNQALVLVKMAVLKSSHNHIKITISYPTITI